MKQAYIKLHVSILLAGLTGIFGKLITLNEGLLAWYRLLLSTLILLIYLVLFKKLRKVSMLDFAKLACTGVLLAFAWIFFYGSIRSANISIAVICFSTAGFFTAVLAPLINRRSVQPAELILSCITLSGVFIIFQFDSHYRTGVILGILSSLFLVLFTIANERFIKKQESTTIIFYEMLGGFMVLTLLLPFYVKQLAVHQLLPSLSDWGYLLLLSLFCTVGMYFLLTQALKKISAFTVNLSFNLEPVYSIILAVLFFSEDKEFSGTFYIGLLLICLSISLQMIKEVRSRHRTGNQALRQ